MREYGLTWPLAGCAGPGVDACASRASHAVHPRTSCPAGAKKRKLADKYVPMVT